MVDHVEVVRDGFARLFTEGPGAIAPLLAADAEWLAADPDPWVCNGRDQIIRRLSQAFEQGNATTLIDCSGVGEHVIAHLGSRSSEGAVRDHYSAVTFRGDYVVRIKDWTTEAEARRSLTDLLGSV